MPCFHSVVLGSSRDPVTPSNMLIVVLCMAPTHELVFAPGGSLADMREEDDSHHQHIGLQKEITGLGVSLGMGAAQT